MQACNNGGPAFPVQFDGCLVPAGGMSLHDWFAGQAITLFGEVWKNLNSPHDAEAVARRSYEIANAMIAERERQVASVPTA